MVDVLNNATHGHLVRDAQIFGQCDAQGDWRALAVDESGRIFLGTSAASIGAVKLEDADSSKRAEIGPANAARGNALQTLPFVDRTGNAQAALVDASGRIILSQVDFEIGAVELKNFDSDLRAEVSYPGSQFGPALHTLIAVDATGQAQPVEVDGSGWLKTHVMTSVLPSGAATEATLQDVRDLLDIVDDWDESDRAKVNPIVGQAGVAADAGASDALTQRVIIANTNPTYAVENAAAPTYTEQVGGKFETVLSQLGDGDIGPLAITAFKKLITAAHDAALGADRNVDIAPVLYDPQTSIARAAAALPAAGAFDAAPTEIPTGGRKKVGVLFLYDEDAGAANGAGKYIIEGCVTETGADHWGGMSAGEQQAIVQGANVETWLQVTEYEFDPVGAAEEGITRLYDISGFHKIRISAAESGDVANPGACEILVKFDN